MAIAVIGSGGVVAEVDGASFRALRVTPRAPNYTVFGAYECELRSGNLLAALAAGTASLGHVWAFRWADNARTALVTFLSLRFQATTTFTVNTLTDFGFDAFVMRNFVNTHTGGTGFQQNIDNDAMRTAMGSALVLDIRIATGAALGFSPILGIDANAFAASVGDTQVVNPVANAEEQRVNEPSFTWRANVGGGQHPLVFAQNEGIIIRNRTIWPLAGNGYVVVKVRWLEIDEYR